MGGGCGYGGGGGGVSGRRRCESLRAVGDGCGGAWTGSEGKKWGASRSWILLDAVGDEQVLDADKYAIMCHVDINVRDLRILDPLLSYPSTILGRERAIVLNLEVPLPSPIPSAFASSIVSFFVRWVAWEEESRSSVCGAGFL